MKALLLITMAGCGYALGRAPASVSAALGDVTAPVAEPGLQEDLERALAAEISRRVPLSGEGAPRLSAAVISAEVRAGAPEGLIQEARLSIRFTLEGGAAVDLQGRRGFPLSVDDPVSSASARAQAFASLCEELSAEATARLLSAPYQGG